MTPQYARIIWVLSLSLVWVVHSKAQSIYREDAGTISFVSEAPLEVIRAASDELEGVLDAGNRTFAFRLRMQTFQGFNSPLQRVHFNENYLESDRYPEASYLGKIIEDPDFNLPGTYQVRAKGVLTIHGIAVERIIKGTIYVDEEGIRIEAGFSVPLSDHDIKVPAIVNQKIAREIHVEMSIRLQ